MEGCQSQPKRNGLSNQGLKNKRMRSFRTIARQVMIANSFTRRAHARSTSSIQTTTGSHRHSAASAAKDASSAKLGRPQMSPSMKQQTAELFPMSTEMKETLASLGKLHFLPEVDQKKRGEKVFTAIGDTDGSKKSSSKFRDKTRRKLIQPQRFIRNIRTSIAQVKGADKPESKTTSPVSNNLSEDCESVELNENEDKRDIHAFKPKGYAWTGEGSSLYNKPATINLSGMPRSRNNCLDNQNPRAMSSERPADVWSIGVNAKRLLLTRKKVAAATKRPMLVNETVKDLERSEVESASSKDRLRNSSPPNWESVEELTTGIQQKCRKWLEVRYGHIN